jgi:hypothetical protein
MGNYPGMWVRNNYVNRLGIYLVLPVEIGGNVSLDRTTSDMAKAARRYAAKGGEQYCRLMQPGQRRRPDRPLVMSSFRAYFLVDFQPT